MLKDNLKKNISQTISRQIIALSISFLTGVFIARTLGPYENGQLSLTLLFSSSFSIILNMGIGAANVFFVGQNINRLKTACINNLILWITLSFLGLTVGFYIITPLSENLVPGLPSQLILASVFCFPFFLFQTFSISLLQSIQNFKSYNLAQLSVPITIFALCIASFYMGHFSPLEIYLCFVIAQIVSSVVATQSIIYQLSHSDQKKRVSDLGLYDYSRKSIIYAWKAYVSNILTLLNYRADMLIINAFLSARNVGLYAISVQISEKIWIFSSSISTVVLPKLVELNRDDGAKKELAPRIAWATLAISATLAVPLMFSSHFIIDFLFGSAFTESITPLILLLPGIVLLSFARIFANDIASRDKPEINLFINLVVLASNIIMNLMFIPQLGISGAALATTISYSINTFLSIFMYQRISGHKVLNFFSTKAIK